MKRKTVGTVGSLLAAGAVLLLLEPAGLDPAGYRALAVIVLAVGFWAADVLASGITAVGALGLLLALKIPAATALAGAIGTGLVFLAAYFLARLKAQQQVVSTWQDRFQPLLPEWDNFTAL